jgi:hypothetical protein
LIGFHRVNKSDIGKIEGRNAKGDKTSTRQNMQVKSVKGQL